VDVSDGRNVYMQGASNKKTTKEFSGHRRASQIWPLPPLPWQLERVCLICSYLALRLLVSILISWLIAALPRKNRKWGHAIARGYFRPLIRAFISTILFFFHIYVLDGYAAVYSLFCKRRHKNVIKFAKFSVRLVSFLGLVCAALFSISTR